MRRLILPLCILFLCGSVLADDYAYSVGEYGGIAKFSGGSVFNFKMDGTYGIALGHSLGRGWQLGFDISRAKLNNQATTATDSLGQIPGNAPIDFVTWRIGGALYHPLYTMSRRLQFVLGAGGGMMVWKIVDRGSGATLETIGEHQGKLDFAASELFVSASTGAIIHLARQWSIDILGRGDYLTGAGPAFASEVNQKRDRWLFGATMALTLHFGRKAPETWRSDQTWPNPAPKPNAPATATLRDSDGDGVPDDIDQCPNTPKGVVVDAHGCPIDSDGDGVPDGLDDCPNTPPAARGKVDIHGCPIDSDFDGVPDYLDKCPYSPAGARVDSVGCPIDSDGDGVPDGLDDCPNTLPGTPVDRYGCIDVAIFAQPMILNVDYLPGSFEFDSRSRQKLERLARLLTMVPDMKLDINAYTDNIGTAEANARLSEKRANRIRDFLVTNGIATDRIRPNGKGELNPAASNQTAEGRAKNRRIEIVFYK